MNLEEIIKDKLADTIKLNISEQQKSFVSSTAYSLAKAYVYQETAFPFAVYTGVALGNEDNMEEMKLKIQAIQ